MVRKETKICSPLNEKRAAGPQVKTFFDKGEFVKSCTVLAGHEKMAGFYNFLHEKNFKILGIYFKVSKWMNKKAFAQPYI